MTAVFFFHSAFLKHRAHLWPLCEASCAELFLDSFLYENSCQLNDAGLMSSVYDFIPQRKKASFNCCSLSLISLISI